MSLPVSSLLRQHISSLRSAQSSTPSHVLALDTRLPLTQRNQPSSSGRGTGQRSGGVRSGLGVCLTVGVLALAVAGHGCDLAVDALEDPDAVGDLTLRQRVLVTLATDADAAAGEGPLRLLQARLRLLQALVQLPVCVRRAPAGVRPGQSGRAADGGWAGLLTGGSRAPGTPR